VVTKFNVILCFMWSFGAVLYIVSQMGLEQSFPYIQDNSSNTCVSVNFSFSGFYINFAPSLPSVIYTRWFKYDRDLFVCKQCVISPGHIWTTLYITIQYLLICRPIIRGPAHFVSPKNVSFDLSVFCCSWNSIYNLFYSAEHKFLIMPVSYTCTIH
jgi:hypothetical protein